VSFSSPFGPTLTGPQSVVQPVVDKLAASARYAPTVTEPIADHAG
jgi:hypothetical protein